MVVGVFGHLKPIKALVIGDLILDVYITGKADRISPEAPVPVLLVENQHALPGGAGNVVLNLQALGAEVTVFGRLGDDDNGQELKKLFLEKGISTEGIFIQKQFCTTTKKRVIADSQQLIRIDFEQKVAVTEQIEKALLDLFKASIDSFDIVAISDYGKGVLSDHILTEIIKECRSRSKPVIVDPKGNDFQKYKNATIIKPNLKEAYAAAKCSKEVSLDEVAQKLLQETQAEMLLITRSEHGMTLFDQKGVRKDFPVTQKDVKDVTGAGDTALAMLAFAYANDLTIDDAISLANIASGIAIEKLGCASVKLSEIAKRLLDLDMEGKIFDEKYLFVLKRALEEKQVVLLDLQNHNEITASLFEKIQNVSISKGDAKLIVYISNKADSAFTYVLSSLPDIDFIVRQSESLANLSSMIPLEKIYC